MDDGQTIDVGHVHVQVMLDGVRRCTKNCPHPAHEDLLGWLEQSIRRAKADRANPQATDREATA